MVLSSNSESIGRESVPLNPSVILSCMKLFTIIHTEVKRKNDEMEILFHPGDVTVPADVERLTSKDDYNFLTSSNRMKEAEALKKFGSNLSR